MNESPVASPNPQEEVDTLTKECLERLKETVAIQAEMLRLGHERQLQSARNWNDQEYPESVVLVTVVDREERLLVHAKIPFRQTLDLKVRCHFGELSLYHWIQYASEEKNKVFRQTNALEVLQQFKTSACFVYTTGACVIVAYSFIVWPDPAPVGAAAASRSEEAETE